MPAITGDMDVMLMLRLHRHGGVRCVVRQAVRDQTNVARFVTMVVIKTAKEETAIRV